MVVISQAPSNLALIKYMGKIEGFGNKPTNASLSWTLGNLKTQVEVSLVTGEDRWAGKNGFTMGPQGAEKFLKHFRFLKEKWGVKENFLIQSFNNFPSDCGLASSASSFAALTKAAAQMFQQINPQPWGEDVLELSRLSRQGSGSSCRSFFPTWSLWRDEGAEALELPLKLHHAVLILESEPKKVSSSEAHKRVMTSPKFQGRIRRAEQKLEDLLSAIRSQDWKMGREIIWDEFEDMHDLFHTSVPPFRYITPHAREILNWCQSQWKKEGHGPWVTLDAGPNIHFLFEEGDQAWAQKFMNHFRNERSIMSWENVSEETSK